MKISSRLDSISPELAEAYRQANVQQRMHAVLAACLVAVAQTGLEGDDVHSALDLLKKKGIVDRFDIKRNLNDLTAQFDEKYLKLSENTEGTTPDALRMFRKARTTAALAFAVSPDSEQLHEALYEAIIASSNQTEAIQAANAALGVH